MEKRKAGVRTPANLELSTSAVQAATAVTSNDASSGGAKTSDAGNVRGSGRW